MGEREDLFKLRDKLNNCQDRIHLKLREMFKEGIRVEVCLGGNVVTGIIEGPRVEYGNFFDVVFFNEVTGKRREFNPLFHEWRFL